MKEVLEYANSLSHFFLLLHLIHHPSLPSLPSLPPQHQPADLTVTAAVEEMRNKLSSLLITPNEGGTHVHSHSYPTAVLHSVLVSSVLLHNAPFQSPNSLFPSRLSLPPLSSDTEPPPMTSARVILNSLIGLLQKCEGSVLHMLEVMETVNIPEEWEIVDIIKQTMALMVVCVCVCGGAHARVCACVRACVCVHACQPTASHVDDIFSSLPVSSATRLASPTQKSSSTSIRLRPSWSSAWS